MPLLEICSLSKAFQSGKTLSHAIQDVSLSIEKGDIYGIIGLSGAGKSTFIRLLAQLIDPTSGKILFHGQDLAKLDRAALRQFRKKVGMIFQHFNLLHSRTVAGNIAFPLEVAGASQEAQDQRVDELLSIVGLTSKKESYPSQLSGGEKQRVGIARALANFPEVLLSDEATSALDPKNTRETLRLIQSINQNLGVTVVLITHEMEVIKQICNKVAVLDHGRIVEYGKVSDIFAEPSHSITKQLVQSASHEIPPEFLHEPSPNRRLLKLRFKGQTASEPVISEIVRKYAVDANILSGWIDRVQGLSIGLLVIELSGTPDGIEKSIEYLQSKGVEVDNGL